MAGTSPWDQAGTVASALPQMKVCSNASVSVLLIGGCEAGVEISMQITIIILCPIGKDRSMIYIKHCTHVDGIHTWLT